MLKSALHLLFCICLWTVTVFAQGEIGGASLNGTVTDSSGAAVPGAKVTATNPATGLTRTTTTDQTGLYNFQQLPVTHGIFLQKVCCEAAPKIMQSYIFR